MVLFLRYERGINKTREEYTGKVRVKLAQRVPSVLEYITLNKKKMQKSRFCKRTTLK